MKKTLAFGALLATAALWGCGSSGGSLATVNGTPISNDEFNSYLEIKPSVRVVVSGQAVDVPVADTLGFQAMQDLVTQKIVLQLAKDGGMEVKPEDVEKEIKFKSKLQPNYIQTLQGRGLTMLQIRQSVELELAKERLQTKGVKVELSEVDKLIKDRPELFIEKEKAALELIYVSTQAKRQAVEKELASGGNFTTIRQKHDESPPAMRAQFDSTRLAGDGLPIEDLQEPFRSAVKKTKEGRYTDWMRAGTGWGRLLVHKRIPQKKIEVTAERKQFLQREMAKQRGSEKNDLQKLVSQKLRDSKIEIVDPGLKDPWERFEERLKAAAAQAKPAAGK